MKHESESESNERPSNQPEAPCQCYRIRLKQFLTRSSVRSVWNGDGSKRVYRFEPPQQVSEESRCSLCRLLATSCNVADGETQVDVLSWYSYGTGRTLKDMYTSIFGFEIDTKTSLRLLPLGDDAHLFGRMPANLGRELDSNTANRRLMRGWLDRCLKTHQRCQKVQLGVKGRSQGPRRLLNTKTKVLESVRTDYRYFALSYVWGEASKEIMEQLSTISWDTAEQSVAQFKMPLVVEGAIRLTNDLGESYLWVDFLCINQNDQQEKLTEIARMNEIYLSATMTIVALGSSNASCPLPGVDEYQPPRKQRTEEWEGIRLTTVYHSASEIYSQPDCMWNTRAWTMQEHLLSQRILFMGPNQAYFSCGTASYSEDRYEFDNDIYQMHHHPGKLLLDPSKEYRSVPWQVWKKYTELYSARDCTVETDRYLAFQGVLNEQQVSWDMASVAGVPSKHLPLCLLWWHGSSRVASVSSRIGAYPSWSWIGWAGKVNFPLPKRYRTKIKEFRISTNSGTAAFQYGENCAMLNLQNNSTAGSNNTSLLPLAEAREPPAFHENPTAASNVKPALTFSAQYAQLTAHSSTRSDGLLSIHSTSGKVVGLLNDPSSDPTLPDSSQNPPLLFSCILLGVSEATDVKQAYYKPTETDNKKPVGLRPLVRDPMTTPDDKYSWLYYSKGGKKLSNKQLGGTVIQPPLPGDIAPPDATWHQRMSVTARRVFFKSLKIAAYSAKQFFTFLLWLAVVPLGVLLYVIYLGFKYVFWRTTHLYHTAHLLWIEEVDEGVFERRGIGEMKYSELEKLRPETRTITLI